MSNTLIRSVEYGSPAYDAGIEPGDRLIRINGHEFRDILEYRFLSSDAELELEVLKKDGSTDYVTVETDYEELGIEFEESLIDCAQSCTNKCIFCFIDQLPKGMRDTVYFKDDDTRLSFLQGNYVTLTNMSDEEIDRLIAMRVSPINISVHTTNPELRVKMLTNRFAGRIYEIMKKLADNRICMNTQIVLCPEINDGPELERSLRDMAELHPYVNSISVVPVGLTAYRSGLYPLRLYTPEECGRVIDQVEALQEEFAARCGSRLCYLSDEFYLCAGRKIPDAESYEGFPQIENGVGLIASMADEFEIGLSYCTGLQSRRNVAVATGELAADFITELAGRLMECVSGLNVRVYPVKNNFFGGGVNVAGLVCGGDIIKQLSGIVHADALLIPSVMLRDDDDIFLDDVTVGDVEAALGTKVVSVDNDGFEFIEKILDRVIL